MNSFFGGNYTNPKDENVTFKINFIELDVDNTDASSLVNSTSIYKLAFDMGIEGADGKISPATIYSTDSHYSSISYTQGPKIFAKNSSSPYGTWAHEFSHTLGLFDNGYNKGGILNNPPESPNQSEINKIIESSIPAKKG